MAQLNTKDRISKLQLALDAFTAFRTRSRSIPVWGPRSEFLRGPRLVGVFGLSLEGWTQGVACKDHDAEW